jgi:putative hydrolase of the HAD superfamily
LNKNLRYALFDLDNTLYPKSCGLMAAIGNRMDRYMIECLEIRPEMVSRKRRAFLRDFGTTLNALRRYYTVDPDEFLTFVHDIPLSRHLQFEPALDGMLERITIKKVLFTNADAQHARRVLSHLGIMRHFESIIDIHLLEFINKPHRRAYLKAMDILSAQAEECVLVEDSLANIIPAKKLGMMTVMVGDRIHMDGAHYHIQHITDFEKLLAGILASHND